jgi:hypothetical protein
MLLELKKIRTHRGMEGLGYNADMYADGKKVGEVLDEGCGGMPFVYWKDRSAEPEVLAYINTLPLETFDPEKKPEFAELWPDGRKQDLESVLGSLFDEAMWKKDQDAFRRRMEREMLKYILVRLPGDNPDSYRIVKAAPTVATIGKLRLLHPEYTILNKAA